MAMCQKHRRVLGIVGKQRADFFVEGWTGLLAHPTSTPVLPLLSRIAGQAMANYVLIPDCPADSRIFAGCA
jgi:hypothetical protein